MEVSRFSQKMKSPLVGQDGQRLSTVFGSANEMDTRVSEVIPLATPATMVFSSSSPSSPSAPSYLDLDKQEINVSQLTAGRSAIESRSQEEAIDHLFPVQPASVSNSTSSSTINNSTSSSSSSSNNSSHNNNNNNSNNSSSSNNLIVNINSSIKKPRSKFNDGKFTSNKDIYCWICHKEKINISCHQCVRSFHFKCIPSGTGGGGHDFSSDSDPGWICLECTTISKAEEHKSEALKKLDPEDFCILLRFALQTIKQIADVTFHQPVNEGLFPEYKDTIIHPMDFETIEKNIRAKKYGCTESLLSDVKWILHNCYIFNNHNHPLTKNAQYFYRVAKNEMTEIEVCPDCFKNFYIYRDKWFTQPCEKPHALVWARLKGHPYWPAKVVRLDREKNEVDARFFGAHERAWVPVDSCFSLSEYYSWSKPKGQKNKLDGAMAELNTHIEKIKTLFPSKFNYAAPKTPFNPLKLSMFDDPAEEQEMAEPKESATMSSDLSGSNAETLDVNMNEKDYDEDDFDDDDDEGKLVVNLGDDEMVKCESEAENGQIKLNVSKSEEPVKHEPELDTNSPKQSTSKDAGGPIRKPKVKIGKGCSRPTPISSSKVPAKSSVKLPVTPVNDVKQLKEELLLLKKQSKHEQTMHQQKISEMKQNSELVLMELKNSLMTEKQKTIEELEERHRKEVESIKRKQWCAFCLSESIYFCCWNTSYCSFSCQNKHWPKHMSECQQQQQNQQKMMHTADREVVEANNS